MKTKTRYCIQCAQQKPYDPTAKRGTVEAGFKGHSCWDCFKAQRKAGAKLFWPSGLTQKELVYREHLAGLAKINKV